MHSLIATAIYRSRTVLMLLVFLMLMGMISYINIPKEDAPDVPIPVMYVSLSLQGISPEDAVDMLVRPMEEELRTIDGVDEIESTAFEGGGNVVVKFTAGFNNAKALADVRAKVDIAKGKLPTDADEPKVREVNVSLFPIVTLILTGDVPEREMRRIAKDLQDRIEGISGVLEAPIGGLREVEALIEVDRAKLESYALTPRSIIDAVSQNNKLVAAGSLELQSGKYAVKVPGLYTSPLDILNIVLATDGTRTVRMRDVATVTLGFKDATTITRVNGKPAMTLGVSKRIGANIIDVVDRVKAVVESTKPEWPSGLSVTYTSDQSDGIRNMLASLHNNIFISVLLVLVVVVASLGLRSSLLVAFTVPGSFLIAVMLLSMLGLTMNIVVLFSLILAVGMVVDAAIVVIELADVKISEGMSKQEAYIEAASFMAWPVITSTATILCAFMPLLFWPDTVGEFMKFMPITLIFTLSASLILALIFIPCIAVAWPGVSKPNPEAVDNPTTRAYAHLVEWCLDRPWKMIILQTVMFFSIIFSYGFFGHGVEFFPKVEPERANLIIHAKGDFSISEKDAVMREVAQKLTHTQGIQTLSVQTGSGGSGGQQTAEDVIGSVFMEFIRWEDGREKADKILEKAKADLNSIPGIKAEAQQERAGPGGNKPIQIVITGPVYDHLIPIARTVQKNLEQLPGAINVDTNMPEKGIEWALKIDRAEAAKYGTNLTEVGTMIRLATTGAKLDEYRTPDEDDELDITARFTAPDRTLSSIEHMTIATPNGRVPLSHMVTREAEPKVSVIRRLDQKSAITIGADIAPGFLADDIVQLMKKGVAQAEAAGKIPHGVEVVFKGEDEKQAEAGAFLQKAFLAALFLIAILMVTQFNSFYQAFVILTAVIFSTAGVFLGHMIIAQPFGIIMGGLGVISLAGIVVGHNIVLVDTFNKFRESHPHLTPREWIVDTCRHRLRPVLLTTLTTVIGLLPLSMKMDFDFIQRIVYIDTPSTHWWYQLSASIAFGLTFATVLTLILTPCLLYVFYRKKESV